jgi:hypothetical protein
MRIWLLTEIGILSRDATTLWTELMSWHPNHRASNVRDADFQGIARAAMSPEICLTFLNVRDTDHDLSKPGKNDEMRRLTAQQKHR